MLRRSLAVVLLLAQASAALHLVLAAHATGDSGAVVEAQPLCSQEGHGSAGIAHGHAALGVDTECEAVALARTAACATVAPSAAVAVDRSLPLVAERSAPAFAPLEVLSVAPKASPPV
ncbi:MAG: hypothetical protein IPJ65_20280 [Archangiaceae bacterium]|nr:hypothetical protein [Archangiaceae bacterium]